MTKLNIAFTNEALTAIQNLYPAEQIKNLKLPFNPTSAIPQVGDGISLLALEQLKFVVSHRTFQLDHSGLSKIDLILGLQS